MQASLGYALSYVPDVASALTFYQAAFGFTTTLLTPEGDYGELDTGTTTLGFVAEDLARANLDSAGGFAELRHSPKPPGFNLSIIVDDVALAIERAEAAGATRYVEPVRKPWGQTVAYLLDPTGLLLEIATPVAAT